MVGVGEGFAHEEAVVALFDLLDCPGVVISVLVILFLYQDIISKRWGIRSHWDITTVQNPEIAGEWIRLEGDVVATTGSVSVTISKEIDMGGDILKVQPTRALPNPTRAKPRTGSIRGSCVERGPYIISPTS